MHMAANLCKNIKDSLEEQPIRKFYGWTDSSVALHWTRGRGSYKQFVSNRVNKIREKDFISWRHVPTDRNPADISSRGCSVEKIPTEWWNGPSWLQYQQNWPPDINTEPTVETENEVKKLQEVLRVSIEPNHQNDEIFKKFSLWKALRIKCWIRRFTVNCRKSPKERIRGPLTTIELEKEKHHLIKITQQSRKKNPGSKNTN